MLRLGNPTIRTVTAMADARPLDLDQATATAETDAPGDGPDFADGKPLYDAGDPEHVQRAKRRLGRLAKARRDFIAQSLMGTRAGRAYVWELLTFCHVFRTSIVAGDPYGTHVQEGERNVGLKLLADVNEAAPEAYRVMVEEAKENR